MNTTKIFFLLFTPGFSGAEKNTFEMIFQNNQIIPYIICGEGSSRIFPHQLNGGLVYELSAVRKLNRSQKNIIQKFVLIVQIIAGLNFRLIKLINRNLPQVIHVVNIPLSLYCIPSLVFMKLVRAKIKFIFHDKTYKNERKIWENICYSLYDVTVVPTKVMAIKYSSKKCKLLPNGIDTKKYINDPSIARKLKEELHINEEIVIGIFGMISERKNQVHLIKTFGKLLNNYNNIFLLIVGKAEENYLTIVKGALNEIPDSKYLVIDWCQNISDYYKLIDILVNCVKLNESEAFGLTIAEAMSTSKVTVASNTGGIPEYVVNGVNGFLFDPSEETSLYDTLHYICREINNFDHIRREARETILKKYSMELMTANYNKLIKEII